MSGPLVPYLGASAGLLDDLPGGHGRDPSTGSDEGRPRDEPSSSLLAVSEVSPERFPGPPLVIGQGAEADGVADGGQSGVVSPSGDSPDGPLYPLGVGAAEVGEPRLVIRPEPL